jgi:hypothetical protein
MAKKRIPPARGIRVAIVGLPGDLAVTNTQLTPTNMTPIKYANNPNQFQARAVVTNNSTTATYLVWIAVVSGNAGSNAGTGTSGALPYVSLGPGQVTALNVTLNLTVPANSISPITVTAIINAIPNTTPASPYPVYQIWSTSQKYPVS